ncbi:MAG TPA: family 20 glycosylhydrolase, partial [Saprospiraceae bacterium]
PHCQTKMQEEGLKDEHELQSYFITRIEKYLNSKGRNIIGWDEILEGGLAPNATVMSWRGMKGGIEAAKSGHDVIMTPGTHCYFDYYQADPAVEPIAIGGLITLEKVYSFNPVPADLTSTEAQHILGAQANLWTEYITSPQQAEYMAYPRAIALAEVLWTPASRRSWPEFAKRLNQHLERLDGMQVNYARHLNDPSIETISDEKGIGIIWKSQLPGESIYFSRDTTQDNWTEVSAGDVTVISTGGPVFYKSESSRIYSLDYQPSKAKAAQIRASSPPDQLYPGASGIWTLTDGLTGTIHFNGKEWCGWRGQEFTIDLLFKELTAVDSVQINFLNSPGAWIHTPEGFKIEGSIDGTEFNEITSWRKKPLESGRHSITLDVAGNKVKALRVYVLPVLSIPEGKPGAGKAAWTFLDEISVY